ncbi:MAG: hypothetical protein ACRCW3_00015 [Metamycoplasmataceae bacterium]
MPIFTFKNDIMFNQEKAVTIREEAGEEGVTDEVTGGGCEVRS